MQGLRPCSNDVVPLHLSTTITMTGSSSPSSSSSSSSLSMDLDESTETRIQHLITEHPFIIFNLSSCCTCHVMKNFLTTIGVHPTVIQLDDNEIKALSPSTPATFIGGTYIGSLGSLVALHVSGLLVPKRNGGTARWQKTPIPLIPRFCAAILHDPSSPCSGVRSGSEMWSKIVKSCDFMI